MNKLNSNQTQKKKKLKVSKTQIEAQVTLADDLGYGGSTLSLDRFLHRRRKRPNWEGQIQSPGRTFKTSKLLG